MKNKELFLSAYDLSDESPTGLFYKGTKTPAGHKQTMTRGYSWCVITKRQGKSYIWTIPRVLYELTHGVELKSTQMISFIDGNKDNLKISNLKLVRYSIEIKQREANQAFAQFRNVILSKKNPDYFKSPSEWSEPESLEALRVERELRRAGKHRFKVSLGRPKR